MILRNILCGSRLKPVHRTA